MPEHRTDTDHTKHSNAAQEPQRADNALRGPEKKRGAGQRQQQKPNPAGQSK